MTGDRALRHVTRVRRVLTGVILTTIMCMTPLYSAAQDLEIWWFTVDCGGATASTGGMWTVGGTIGQPDAGEAMTGGVFTVTGGFWTPTTIDSADLVINKTDSVDPVAPGSTFSYDLLISNAGPSSASNLVVTDTLPASVSFVSVEGTGWSCGESGGVVTCTLANLLPGDAPMITIETMAPSAAATLLNTADVAASTPDPNTANNVDTENTNILAAADLAIVNWGDPGPVPAGAVVTYTLDVANAGPDAASAVTVIDDLPPEAGFQSADGTGWTCNEAGGTVTCTLPGLASGAGADPISIVVTAPSFSTLMTNWANVSCTTFDPVTGNNSDPATTEVDATPPQVVVVASAADTGDGRISDGEATRAAITQLTAVFSEEVADPAGDTDPDDVTNPANYLLVASGGDGVFDTVSCAGGVGPSDTRVIVNQVLYDNPSMTAFVNIADGGASLPAERYRLLVCGSTSITDLVGQALDGDGDGSPGDDHTLEFSVSASNLLLNPNFDFDLGDWTITSPLPPEVTHAWQDTDGVLTSGAAEIANLNGPGGVYSFEQCVPVSPGQFYRTAGLIRTASTTPGAPTASGAVDFFTAADCVGAPSSVVVPGTVAGDTAGLWRALGGLAQAPAGSISARVWLVLDAGASPDFTAHLDNTIFFDSGFFADDFESGDTDRWSNTVGGTK